MKRTTFKPRDNFESQNQENGFDYGVMDDMPYWEEQVGYQFSNKEVNAIEQATNEMIQMTYDTIDHVIKENKFHLFNIPAKAIPLIKKSWEKEDWSFYGRFDFFFDGREIKAYEYNADTPTSLLEASITQHYWMQGQGKKDQFNSLHEKMIAWWTEYKNNYNPGKVHFACVKDNLEDYRNTEYILDCASQAGLEVEFIFVEDIGSDSDYFYDLNDEPITHLFKLYPWEWMVLEDNFEVIEKGNCQILEPIWKMILSNKALMAVMYELFPDSPYLLPCYFTSEKLGSNFVKKPLLSREGQNVSIVQSNQVEEKEGAYESEQNVYQAVKLLPDFNGFHPVIGSWVIGSEPAGMGIREDEGYITGNMSKFVSHYIED